MNYTITLDNTLKIIRYTHSGDLTYEDIGGAWAELLALQEFTAGKFNLLSDYREAIFKMEITQIKDIVVFLKSIEPVVRGKKQSIIIADPYSTAGTMLFKSEVYAEIGFKVEVFSTETEAIKWLMQ